MGKKIIFTSEEDSNSEMECYANNTELIFISITDTSQDMQFNTQHIVLGRDTVEELIEHLTVELSYIP